MLLSAWEDTAPVSLPPPAFLEAEPEDDPEDDSERDDDRGPRDSLGRGGASFRGPKRPDTAARAAWRARQWTGEYDELDVVRWIPSVTLEHHAELARAVSAYVHRYGASRFLRIVDRAGRSPLWHAVDTGCGESMEHLLARGFARNHDPSDRGPRPRRSSSSSSPWLLAHRLGDREVFSILSNYLDPSLSDEVLESLLLAESRRRSREQRFDARAGAAYGIASALFPCFDCGDDAVDDGGRKGAAGAAFL